MRNDDDTFSPLEAAVGFQARLGGSRCVGNLLPYWTLKPSADDPARMERVGGWRARKPDLVPGPLTQLR